MLSIRGIGYFHFGVLVKASGFNPYKYYQSHTTNNHRRTRKEAIDLLRRIQRSKDY
jgi:hypothetical protein